MTKLRGKIVQERMLECAKRIVLASAEFWTVADLAKLLRVDSRKLDQQFNAWKD
jgi:hypothetical protein